MLFRLKCHAFEPEIWAFSVRILVKNHTLWLWSISVKKEKHATKRFKIPSALSCRSQRQKIYTTIEHQLWGGGLRHWPWPNHDTWPWHLDEGQMVKKVWSPYPLPICKIWNVLRPYIEMATEIAKSYNSFYGYTQLHAFLVGRIGVRRNFRNAV